MLKLLEDCDLDKYYDQKKGPRLLLAYVEKRLVIRRGGGGTGGGHHNAIRLHISHGPASHQL